MGRGLSTNQKRVLGIAYGVNTLYGEENIKSGQPVVNYRVPTVDYAGLKDINWSLAAHKIFDLEFTQIHQRVFKSNGYSHPAGPWFDLTIKSNKSAKASTIRAISSLYKRGYLILAPDSTAFRWGYVLTDQGMVIGRDNFEPIEEWEVFRAGMVTYASDKDAFIYLADAIREGREKMTDIVYRLSSTNTFGLLKLSRELGYGR